MESGTEQKLVYPELSYQIMGCAFEVHNQLGSGLLEKQYQKAMAIELVSKGIKFSEQAFYPVEYKGEVIGKKFLDFLIEDKVVVEIKREEHFARANIAQVLSYLHASGLQLGILIHFGKQAVRSKRILNIR